MPLQTTSLYHNSCTTPQCHHKPRFYTTATPPHYITVSLLTTASLVYHEVVHNTTLYHIILTMPRHYAASPSTTAYHVTTTIPLFGTHTTALPHHTTVPIFSGNVLAPHYYHTKPLAPLCHTVNATALQHFPPAAPHHQTSCFSHVIIHNGVPLPQHNTIATHHNHTP